MAIPESTSSKADQFFDRALERIRKFMLALAVVGLLVCVVFFRWPVAAGFATGAGRLLCKSSLAGARGRSPR